MTTSSTEFPIPPDVEGFWSWELAPDGIKRSYSSIFEQKLQMVEGFLRSGNRRALLSDVKLRGDEITFTVSMTLDRTGFTRHEFTGRVRGDTIEGVAKVSWPKKENDTDMESRVLPWRATRTQTSGYFAPTGRDAK